MKTKKDLVDEYDGEEEVEPEPPNLQEDTGPAGAGTSGPVELEDDE